MDHHPPVNDAVERRVTTPFGTMALLQWGAVGAPPLLALHGWLDNAAGFTSLAPLLADRHHVLALDLPGHGHSAHLASAVRRYHVVDQIGHVLDVADALGLARFDLLGHSLGAGIASLLAAAVPERVHRLVLVEGLGPLADGGTETLTRWREAHARRRRGHRPPRVFPSVQAAVEARVMADSALTADEVRPIVRRNLREVEDGFVWRSDARLRRTTPVRLAEDQVRSLLAGIGSPTMLLLAEPETPYLPARQMQARAVRVGGIRVEHMAGPHHLHVRHPQAVAARIRRFLAREGGS